jgi:biopolymer transport protein TolQ
VDPVSAVSPVDLSILHLVSQADIVVKVVMGLLVFFSVICWSVIIEKLFTFASATGAAGRLESALKANSVDEMLKFSDPHPVTDIIAAGNAEWREGSGEHAHEALHEVRDRIEKAMRLALSDETRRINTRLPFLATVGSSAPFIGLFGTVWGIMQTFTGIGASHDTSLATVAPGIAEALIATAIGLFAAIPSIMFYNHFATTLSRYTGRLGTAIGTYAGRLSKRLPPKAGS